MAWTSTKVLPNADWHSLFLRPAPCLEIGQCDTSWRAAALLGIWLLGPAFACGTFAAIGIRSQWKTKRVLRLFAITWLATLALIGFLGLGMTQPSEMPFSMTVNGVTTVVVDL